MNIHTPTKVTTQNSRSKVWPNQAIKNKTNVKNQVCKINPLCETPFDDVVTNQYVRGYN